MRFLVVTILFFCTSWTYQLFAQNPNKELELFIWEPVKVTQFLNGDKLIVVTSLAEWKFNYSRSNPPMVYIDEEDNYFYNNQALSDDRKIISGSYSTPSIADFRDFKPNKYPDKSILKSIEEENGNWFMANNPYFLYWVKDEYIGDREFAYCAKIDTLGRVSPQANPKNFGVQIMKKKDNPDWDGDGLDNSEDPCPGEFGKKSNDGCPDSDNDGVVDKYDRCPEVNGPFSNDGCPWPDTDGDGVLDKDDNCPNEPGVNSARGCPDSDGDGVRDSDDKCPNESGTTYNDGCPESNVSSTPSYGSSGFSFSPFDGTRLTPFIAWPYITSIPSFYNDSNYTHYNTSFTFGVNHMLDREPWTFGYDLAYSPSIEQNFYGNENQRINYKCHIIRFALRANRFYGQSDRYYFGGSLGLQFRGHYFRDEMGEKSNYWSTQQAIRIVPIGAFYDNGFAWEIGFGGGGFLLGYSLTL